MPGLGPICNPGLVSVVRTKNQRQTADNIKGISQNFSQLFVYLFNRILIAYEWMQREFKTQRQAEGLSCP